MIYDLMHKDTTVLRMRLNDGSGLIESVEDVLSLRHLPVGTSQNGFLNGTDLKSWWAKRSIPASRSGIKDVLYRLDIPCTTALLSRCFGLSLSDHYWIKESGSDIRWDNINFFDNSFSEDLGDLMFGNCHEFDIDLNTPDNTTDGVLKKRWKVVDGRRCLIKTGGGVAIQEPFNEAVASCLMDAMSIDHVEYGIVWSEGRPCSICSDFIDKSTELVTASCLLKRCSSKKDSLYERYVEECSTVGIDIVPFLDRMIVVDHIMANGDRHLNNFGLIRDPDTLEFLGPAPIYDTGTSLGYGLLTKEFPYRISEASRPFKKTFDEQLGLVSSFDWLDLDNLERSVPDAKKILSTDGFLDVERVDAIVRLLEKRISRLRGIAEDCS